MVLYLLNSLQSLSKDTVNKDVFVSSKLSSLFGERQEGINCDYLMYQ